MEARHNRLQAVDTSRYVLHHLIEIDRVCDRYEATLADGQACEACLLHADVCLESVDRRLRLLELAEAPSARHLLLTDLTHSPPLVAIERAGQPATQALADHASPSASAGQLILCLVHTLQRCHQVGLFVSELNLAMLSWSSDGQWKVDLTGLRSDRIASTDSESLLDSAGDILALGNLVRSLTAQSGLFSDGEAQRWDALFADCLVAEPLDRPTMSQLAARLSQDASCSFSYASGSQNVPSLAGHGRSSQAFDVTSDFDTVPVATTSGQAATAALDPSATPSSGQTSFFLALAAGSRIGRYTIETRLGVGGMGAVYRARDQVDQSLVAIKVLNRQVARDSNAAARFAKEARMLAKANNPYVASLFDVNSEGEVPFMAFEYVDGGSLGELLKAGEALDEKLALALIADAVRGLAIAHKRGIIHRDIKPDNVLLTRAARDWAQEIRSRGDANSSSPAPPLGPIYAKVSDFGLARTLQQSESLAVTNDGTILGTPMYMSPEQCKGQPAGYASDVYSVGVTLFQMLTGQPPFEADTHVALMNQHCHQPPPALKQLRPQLPEPVVAVVEKCLAKNPDARYANAAELLVDLENLLHGEPTSLRLHPPVLSLQDRSALRFEHSWELKSSPAELWPYVSNTDRINHAIGLPAVNYTTRQDSTGAKQRLGEATIACQKIRWQEHPYEWIEGKRLSVLREFADGPFQWFANIVELQPSFGGGTRLTQSLIVSPRNWLGRKFARFQLGSKSRESFGRVYHHIDHYLQQSQLSAVGQDPFAERTELTPAGHKKLQVRLEHLREQGIDPIVVDTLGQFLEHASDLEVARIRPLAFAERFRLDSKHTINAFLIGSRCGLFTLLWDILCPTCRISASTQETLATLKDHGYCEACDIRYALDLSQSVELVFRAHPELRDVETRTYCIGGPAWSKHVVAQIRLARGERFACELELSAGSYLLRGPNLGFTVNMHVGHSSNLSSVELSLTRPPQLRTPIPLQVGSQVVHLNNDSGQDQQVRLERTASRHDALSAAQASTLAMFRELFPDQVLSAEQIVSVMVITLMRVELHGVHELYRSRGDAQAFSQIRGELEKVLQVVKDAGGAVVKTIGEGILASFASPPRAVAAALKLHPMSQREQTSLPLSVAIHSGPVMAATLDDRLDYFGTTLQCLARMIALAPPHSILASDSITQGEDVRALLKESGVPIELFASSASEREPNLSGVVVHRLQAPA